MSDLRLERRTFDDQRANGDESGLSLAKVQSNMIPAFVFFLNIFFSLRCRFASFASHEHATPCLGMSGLIGVGPHNKSETCKR